MHLVGLPRVYIYIYIYIYIYVSLLPTHFYTGDLHKFSSYPTSVPFFSLVQAVGYSQLISLE